VNWMSLWFQSMRGLCQEEDYAFLGTPEKTTAGTPEGASEDDRRDRKEDRVRGEEGRHGGRFLLSRKQQQKRMTT